MNIEQLKLAQRLIESGDMPIDARREQARLLGIDEAMQTAMRMPRVYYWDHPWLMLGAPGEPYALLMSAAEATLKAPLNVFSDADYTLEVSGYIVDNDRRVAALANKFRLGASVDALALQMPWCALGDAQAFSALALEIEVINGVLLPPLFAQLAAETPVETAYAARGKVSLGVRHWVMGDV